MARLAAAPITPDRRRAGRCMTGAGSLRISKFAFTIPSASFCIQDMPNFIREPSSGFCRDDELGYESNRTQFFPGRGLMLDDAYRLAHLPLIAPGHPSVIPTRAGSTYNMGRHDCRYSLVMPIPASALLSSSAYQELERELKAACFAPKIAWSLLPQRQGKLHATICGSLSRGEESFLNERQRRRMTQIGPVQIELRGLFSGNVNVGRLYLRVYPERRNGANVCKDIQRAVDRPETSLYLVGVFNFTDDLDVVEASALNALLQRWWDRPLVNFTADHLCVLGAMDDLVLDSAVVETIPLI